MLVAAALLALVAGSVAGLAWSTADGRQEREECTGGECPTASVTPELEIEGDSNDEAASQWTPPVPPATPEITDAGPTVRQWVPGAARDGFLPTTTPSPTATATPEPDKPVYLTFDDGPHPQWTGAVLDALERHSATATFFVLGVNADAYPGLLTRARAIGKVANHSYNHIDLSEAARSTIEEQISWPLQAGSAACGRTSCCFRPPYGAYDAAVSEVAQALGFQLWLWDLDPRDWTTPGTGVIVDRVLRNVRSGSVILLHDGGGNRSQTAAALDILLPTLRGRGYEFRTLPC